MFFIMNLCGLRFLFIFSEKLYGLKNNSLFVVVILFKWIELLYGKKI